MYSDVLRKLDFNAKKKTYESSTSYLQKLGTGKRATVFKIKGEDLVIKVFHPNMESEALKEIQAYQKIQESNDFYVRLHAHGKNFIVIDYVEGNTLYDCFFSGTIIPESVIHKVDDAIEYARSKGLNPSDIHVKNIFWHENKVTLIDLEGFVREGRCVRWSYFKRFYYKYYIKSWFPKRVPRGITEFLANSYRKIEKLLGYKQKR